MASFKNYLKAAEFVYWHALTVPSPKL